MVGEYGVLTANAGLSQIVSDPADGTLWFTEAAADKVGSDQLRTTGHRRVRRADRGCCSRDDRGRQERERLVHRVERQ